MAPYELLEKDYAAFVGTKYAVSTNTGTSALHLALVALGIGVGDEVIVPDFTMAACGFAVSYTGAKPVFVDCGEDLNIDPKKIEAKITKKTKAIMPVHIYGRLCDMKAIKAIAKKHKLFIIEDGCEAQGAAKGGNSDALVFSFYKNKIIPAEEGGILCTDNYELYKNAQDLKNMAFGEKHDYFHERIGFNYRMSDSQATMARMSLMMHPMNEILIREIEEVFDKYFYSKPHDAVWVYDIMSEKKKEYMDKANKWGFPVRHFFKPLSAMPMWKQKVGENAARYSTYGFYFPISPTMKKDDVDIFCKYLTS